MTEHPILFSAPLVRAILEGRKTVTRRPVAKPKRVSQSTFDEAMDWAAKKGTPGVQRIGPCDGLDWRIMCPSGLKGDRLWVRETWACPQSVTYYRADEAKLLPPGEMWRPSIHMPRWASRLTLEVLDVRVERLQSITEEDAQCEGADNSHCENIMGDGPITRRDVFAHLWDAIYSKGPHAWNSNPWVWRLEFRKVEL